ncbi:MAG: arsenite methyltransferase [Myxococcales bacterium]|nr:arsenite methyltransferase [Myxococcales bacterium]
MSDMNPDQVRDAVRDHYGKVAEADAPGCAPGCCGGGAGSSLKLGYSEEDLARVPTGADLGLGCGNPQAIADLRPGETVVDLGSGAGFDCFLAANRVGPTGKVIGVDMTPSMISKARGNAQQAGIEGIEFRLGEIEHLPVADAAADVILSNCVINLVPDKKAAFRESFRVLKPGGRLAISDVVMIAPLPEALQAQVAALTGCVSGASSVDELRRFLTEAGFTGVSVDVKPGSREFIRDWIPGSGSEEFIASAAIQATKPAPEDSAATKEQECCGPSCCS